jgi:RNA polymerase sigma-70 factor (ECF subfamily)
LPVKYQEVLSLRYFEKKSIAEISQIMSKRPGTIKSLLSRGTKKLREEPK